MPYAEELLPEANEPVPKAELPEPVAAPIPIAAKRASTEADSVEMLLPSDVLTAVSEVDTLPREVPTPVSEVETLPSEVDTLPSEAPTPVSDVETLPSEVETLPREVQIFAKSLKISAAKKLTIEPRFIGYEFLTNHIDAVITHHWEIDLNYLYYEVLFGKYPLIHNSEPLREYGYYYESFNPEAGAEALILAHRTHANSLEEYDAKNAELFKRLDPTNPDNIAFHENLMFKTGRSEDAKGQMVLAR